MEPNINMVEKSIPYSLSHDLERAETIDVLVRTKGKTFLITGGNGFFAYYLTLTLLQLNDKLQLNNHLLLLVRSEVKALQKYGDLLQREDIELIVQDVCAPLNYTRRKIDFIIHAASSADAKHFEADPIGIFNANVLGTENMLQLAKAHATTSVLYISSFTVYGDCASRLETIDEMCFGGEPWNLNRASYPLGKRSAEFLCMAANRKENCPVKIIRPGFVYGMSGKDDSRVYAEIIRNVANQKPIVLKSSGQVYRSMIYVTDLVRAAISVLLCGEDGEAYNAANEHISIRQFAECASHIAGNKSCLVFQNQADANVPVPTKILGKMSNEKILMHCGWKPSVDIKDGISMAADAYGFFNMEV